MIKIEECIQDKSEFFVLIFVFDFFFFSLNRKQEAANMLAPQYPQGPMILSFGSAALTHGLHYQGHSIVLDVC